MRIINLFIAFLILSVFVSADCFQRDLEDYRQGAESQYAIYDLPTDYGTNSSVCTCDYSVYKYETWDFDHRGEEIIASSPMEDLSANEPGISFGWKIPESLEAGKYRALYDCQCTGDDASCQVEITVNPSEVSESPQSWLGNLQDEVKGKLTGLVGSGKVDMLSKLMSKSSTAKKVGDVVMSPWTAMLTVFEIAFDLVLLIPRLVLIATEFGVVIILLIQTGIAGYSYISSKDAHNVLINYWTATFRFWSEAVKLTIQFLLFLYEVIYVAVTRIVLILANLVPFT